jgi:hypothetical protein
MLLARVITLGRATSERVDTRLTELHEWIATTITSTNILVSPYDYTINLTFDELVDGADELADAMATAYLEPAPQDAVLVVDLMGNSGFLLNEPFLGKLGRYLRLWRDAGQDRVVVLLLPDLPSPEASLLWLGLQDLPEGHSIFIVARDGRLWADHSRSVAIDALHEGFLLRLHALPRREDALRYKVLRELGHFEIEGSDGPQCARYFFDAELAIAELGGILTQRLIDLSGSDGLPTAILTHGERSTWLHEAAMLAADRIGALPVIITNTADAEIFAGTDVQCTIIFDVVNTGTTCRSVIGELIQRGVNLLPAAYAVMRDRSCPPLALPGAMRLEFFREVESEKVRRDECVQCQIGLPFTTPLDPASTPVRAFDMWDALLRFDWEPEPYSPGDVQRLLDSPPMGKIFSEFGDWIAYRALKIVDVLASDREVVIVSPDESEVNELMPWLSERFQGRLVSVKIPRKVLDDFDATGGQADDDITWRTQLLHISGLPRRLIVLLDEFNASGTTARAMVRVVRGFGVTPDIYLPVLNRTTSTEVDGVPIVSIYQVSSPRPQPRPG